MAAMNPKQQTTTTLAAGSVAVGVLVLALKFGAWYVTGSVALYSDALESLVNVAAGIVLLVAVWYGGRPADSNHPYGHGKAEYFSVVLEGVFIILAALAILREAYLDIRMPEAISAPWLGLAIAVLASIGNGAWGYVLVREGKSRNSPALTADGVHLYTDVATTAGVIVGLILAVVTGWTILDPILAIIVAVNIIWAGWRVIRVSIGGLMDEALPPEMLEHIRTVISENADGALEAHDVRTRQAGPRTFIEFHLVVPGNMPVSQSHDICDRIERALRAAVPESSVTIHVEPEEKAKHTGVVVV
jgi:cation diffusion facilitator family transporter